MKKRRKDGEKPRGKLTNSESTENSSRAEIYCNFTENRGTDKTDRDVHEG